MNVNVYKADLIALKLLEQSGSARVLSSHKNCVNFIMGDLQVFSIIKGPYPSGPGRFLVHYDRSFENLSVDTPFFYSDGILFDENRLFLFFLKSAVLWSGKPPLINDSEGVASGVEIAFKHILFSAPSSLKEFYVAAEAVFKGYTLHSAPLKDPVYLKILISFSELRTALLKRKVSESSVKKFCNSIIGLGYGLTPSGDDFISGMLNAFCILSPLIQEKFFDELLYFFSRAVELFKLNTVILSSFFLSSAASGRLGEEVFTMIKAFDARDEKSARKGTEWFIEHGHTSGREFFLGFYCGINLCFELEGS